MFYFKFSYIIVTSNNSLCLVYTYDSLSCSTMWHLALILLVSVQLEGKVLNEIAERRVCIKPFFIITLCCCLTV